MARFPDGYIFVPNVQDLTVTLEERDLVMCKSCRYYNTVGCGEGFGWCENPQVSRGTYDDFFCAKGEKNEA